MFSPCSLLPSELWVQVCGFLCAEDRLRLRAVCKELRDLVDSSALWRDWTVRLRRPYRFYNKGLWKMLRRWRVTSAVLGSPRGWADITTELPGLTSVIIDHDCEAALQTLHCFTNLKRLFLRNLGHLSLEDLLSMLPSQLEHLSVCKLRIIRSWRSSTCLCDSASHLTNLTSLVIHCSKSVDPEDVLQTILTAFPQLTHLSLLSRLSLFNNPCKPSLQHNSLSSLKIVGCIMSFPTNLMLPSLRSVVLFLFGEEQDCSWLKNLPALSSLVVIDGAPVEEFVESIPSSVTHLTLAPTEVSPEEMRALSSQLPNLRHLHLDPWAPLGPVTALIPQAFPRLHSLRIRHDEVPEEALISLAALRELQLLEIVDEEPPPEELASKHRQLIQSPTLSICRRAKYEILTESKDALHLKMCPCIDKIYRGFWFDVWTEPGLTQVTLEK